MDRPRTDKRTIIRRRQKEQKEELRAHILRTAGQLFVELGYSNFSMRKLAERIGYSPATLYVYFRDKDDLLFLVVDDAFMRFTERLEAAASGGTDMWERLGRLGEAYVTFGLEHPAYYQLMFMWRIDYLMEPQGIQKIPRVQAFDVLLRTVRDAMEQGVLRAESPETASDLLWAAMHGIVSLSIQMPMFNQQRTEKLMRHAMEMLYKALHS
ncbi:TetR/AcrR family transcriptional regulator [Cohnella pontilimi]|uniref:TetR/AcrR family transcriptional regulator n=1 Tax=Cohnella pontilimi TaxID=2564100 RepID=A0A4U0FHP9_9BACL|nr:TetR/AcrR family transcriptional regulator [Cohnella pontilimi]TJY44497.1 TetR/AcrR family transcriptional regulator [Cohnella pontilimi]